MLKHCIAALAMLGAVTADAIEPSEIFDLCPGEERMRLAIYVYPADSLHSQATSRRIMHAAESRLRAAQIYAPDVWPALEIAVNTLAVGFGPNREVFSVTVSYYRPLRSPSSSFSKTCRDVDGRQRGVGRRRGNHGRSCRNSRSVFDRIPSRARQQTLPSGKRYSAVAPGRRERVRTRVTHGPARSGRARDTAQHARGARRRPRRR